MKALLLTLLVLGMVSCIPESKPPQVVASSSAELEFPHTIKLGAEYYKGGPQQASPPDGTLAAGTKVKIIEDAGSYVLIEAESGEKGYVSSSSVLKD